MRSAVVVQCTGMRSNPRDNTQNRNDPISVSCYRKHRGINVRDAVAKFGKKKYENGKYDTVDAETGNIRINALCGVRGERHLTRVFAWCFTVLRDAPNVSAREIAAEFASLLFWSLSVWRYLCTNTRTTMTSSSIRWSRCTDEPVAFTVGSRYGGRRTSMPQSHPIGTSEKSFFGTLKKKKKQKIPEK